MANYNNFSEALSIGQQGEQAAATLLEESGYQLTDVRQDKHYQAQDIDFLATKGGRTITVEVKTDAAISRYGNLCVETISNKERKKNGWFNTTAADFLFFFDIPTQTTYTVKTEELRNLYRTNCFRHKETFQLECGQFPKHGEIALLPLSRAAELPSFCEIAH